MGWQYCFRYGFKLSGRIEVVYLLVLGIFGLLDQDYQANFQKFRIDHLRKSLQTYHKVQFAY